MNLGQKLMKLKLLINDILQPNIASDDTFDINSKLKKLMTYLH